MIPKRCLHKSVEPLGGESFPPGRVPRRDLCFENMNKHLWSVFHGPDNVNILSYLILTTRVVGIIIPILQVRHKVMNVV